MSTLSLSNMAISGYLRRIFILLSFISITTTSSAFASNETLVQWTGETHQPHFADINGDGISDLLLQTKNANNSSSLVLGVTGDESIEYLTSNQSVLPELSSANITLADLNGDGFSDVFAVFADQHLAMVFAGDPQGLSNAVTHQYSPNELSWLDDATDFEFAAGNFNGDSRQDILAVSSKKHFVMHSSQAGLLSVVQTINGNVKWGQNRAEKLLVKDYNGDGRDDIFAWAKQQNKSHYVIYADENGLLTAKNTQKVNAQITDVDWHGDAHSVAVGNINNDKQLELVRFNNAQGGIDENGVITSAERPIDAPHDSYSLAKSKRGTTQSLLSVPPTPSSYPGNDGSSYKPIGLSYNTPVLTVAGATYYQIYESTTDSNYQQVYSGSFAGGSFIKLSRGYQYYKYKACNSAGCSGLSPWRRIYIYRAPNEPKSLSISPLNVNVGVNYLISWGHANGDVDGTLYTLYQSINGGSETSVYSVARVSWSDPGYSFNTSGAVGGSYRYRVKACSPSVGCGGYSTIYQTVISPNTAPVANADSAVLNQDSYVYVAVLSNDTDAEGQSLTPSIHTAPVHGSVSIVSNYLLYTPVAGYAGSDYIYYRAIDSEGSYSGIAQVALTVNAVMSTPTLSRTSTAKMLEYNLQWSGVTGASRYELYEQKNGGSWTMVYNGVSTSMLFTQPIIANYDYRIKACNSSNVCSSWSTTLPAMRLKSTYVANDTLGTPILRSSENRTTEKTKYSFPYGQQEDKQ